MNKLASRMTDYLLDQQIIDKEDYNIYHYGFESGLELLFCLLFNLLSTVKLGWGSEYLIFVSTFAPLRSFAGGIHLKSYSKCFLCTTLVIHIVMYLSTDGTYPKILIAILYLILIVVISLTQKIIICNKNNKEEVFYTNRLLKILATISVLFIITILYNNMSYAIVILGALMITVFSRIISILTYKTA